MQNHIGRSGWKAENLDILKRKAVAKSLSESLEDSLLRSKPSCHALRVSNDRGQPLAFEVSKTPIEEVVRQRQQSGNFFHIDEVNPMSQNRQNNLRDAQSARAI